MLALLLFFSCKSNNTKGELIGAPGQKWFSEKPFGMELIPSCGSNDETACWVRSSGNIHSAFFVGPISLSANEILLKVACAGDRITEGS